MTDKEYMQLALQEAEKARGKTSPNPLVGCIIVDSQGTIVGRGYHHQAGQPHAEVNALADAGDRARGATAYVTLEPCSHYGRTGPCCEALIKAGIKKVVAAANDPNPQVAGRGFARLREEGVEVVQGVLAPEANRQNEVFMHWMTTGKPFVVLKYAMTLDGKIATATGDSKWITGVEARTQAHYLRSIYDGILVGRETVLKDDPELTCRLVQGKNPLRIILDTNLKLPLNLHVFRDQAAPTLVVARRGADEEKIAKLQELGVRVMTLPTRNGHVDIQEMLKALGRENITSIMVEGGSEIHGAFMDAGEVNRVYAFVAPKLAGGSNGLTPIGGAGHCAMADSYGLREVTTRQLGSDIMITGVVVKEVG